MIIGIGIASVEYILKTQQTTFEGKRSLQDIFLHFTWLRSCSTVLCAHITSSSRFEIDVVVASTKTMVGTWDLKREEKKDKTNIHKVPKKRRVEKLRNISSSPIRSLYRSVFSDNLLDVKKANPFNRMNKYLPKSIANRKKKCWKIPFYKPENLFVIDCIFQILLHLRVRCLIFSPAAAQHLVDVVALSQQ